ncbi:MAG: hypothetical protein V4529_16770 [Gemmatimonadota bacterium]
MTDHVKKDGDICEFASRGRPEFRGIVRLVDVKFLVEFIDGPFDGQRIYATAEELTHAAGTQGER